MTRLSVMVTEAKGDGTVLGAFIRNRLANIQNRRYNEKETMLLVLKAFKFILEVQLDTMKEENCILADLHDHNITVMAGGQGGPLDIKFTFVDAAGLMHWAVC